MTVVEISLAVIGLYLALGVGTAVAIHLAGLRVIDPATAEGATWGFRLLITPGLLALWPLMLVRWRAAAAGRRITAEADAPVTAAALRRRHRWLATALLVLVPGLLLVAIVARPEVPVADSTVRGVLPEPAPLPTVAAVQPQAFADLPIAISLRTDGDGALQLELTSSADLEIPSVVAFWSPHALADDPQAAVFLGAVWGPGIRRLGLPGAAVDGGVVTLYSLGWRTIVGETAVGAVTGG